MSEWIRARKRINKTVQDTSVESKQLLLLIYFSFDIKIKYYVVYSHFTINRRSSSNVSKLFSSNYTFSPDTDWF